MSPRKILQLLLYAEIVIAKTLNQFLIWMRQFSRYVESNFHPVFDDIFVEDFCFILLYLISSIEACKYRNMQFEQNPVMDKSQSCLCERIWDNVDTVELGYNDGLGGQRFRSL
ncbi:hypothetical protein T11_9330 [Trichinella zimbabwensis]|uniref:Uncharacterized protein n=1 Tax=Trichinella zimbabwensis TaxID=268475 RepID=A0A0V1I3P0_9BILA|nr:hypothetical protein T11_9330 [Trichinella zimbabwensis]